MTFNNITSSVSATSVVSGVTGIFAAVYNMPDIACLSMLVSCAAVIVGGTLFIYMKFVRSKHEEDREILSNAYKQNQMLIERNDALLAEIARLNQLYMDAFKGIRECQNDKTGKS